MANAADEFESGRAVDDAYGILLNGEEDDAIADYFIRSAFPTPQDVAQLLTIMQTVGYASAAPAARRSDRAPRPRPRLVERATYVPDAQCEEFIVPLLAEHIRQALAEYRAQKTSPPVGPRDSRGAGEK